LAILQETIKTLSTGYTRIKINRGRFVNTNIFCVDFFCWLLYYIIETFQKVCLTSVRILRHTHFAGYVIKEALHALQSKKGNGKKREFQKVLFFRTK